MQDLGSPTCSRQRAALAQRQAHALCARCAMLERVWGGTWQVRRGESSAGSAARDAAPGTRQSGAHGCTTRRGQGGPCMAAGMPQGGRRPAGRQVRGGAWHRLFFTPKKAQKSP